VLFVVNPTPEESLTTKDTKSTKVKENGSPPFLNFVVNPTHEESLTTKDTKSTKVKENGSPPPS